MGIASGGGVVGGTLRMASANCTSVCVSVVMNFTNCHAASLCALPRGMPRIVPVT